RQCALAGARDQCLAEAAQAVGQDSPPPGIELREHVVEQEQRREASALRNQLSFGKQERQHGQALLALRSESAQVAVAREDPDVVEMWPNTGRAALEVAVQPRLQCLGGRWLGVVAKSRVFEPELPSSFGKGGFNRSNCL